MIDVYGTYTEAVTLEGAASEEPTGDSVVWFRNKPFAEYLDRKVQEEAAAGKTITRIAELGQISRNQFNRWRGVGGPQSIPDADNIIAVCVGNGWPIEEPLLLLGWGVSSADVDNEIRRATVALLEVLQDEDIDDEDTAEALAQLALLESLLRGRAERRRQNRQV